MSAPTSLDEGALVRGIAIWASEDPQRNALSEPLERRARDPISMLSRKHDDLCRQASDPYEITAALEAAGFDDTRARIEYGATSVFDLAEQLYVRVPFREPARRPRPPRWALPLWRAQLRGFLYAAPAVIAAMVPARVIASSQYLLLVIGAAVAIACAQVLSVTGHILIGRYQDRAFRTLARIALATSVVLSITVVGSLFLRGVALSLAVLVGVQFVFVVAATLLIVGHREGHLMTVVLPGALLFMLELAHVRIAGHFGMPATTFYMWISVGTVLATAVTAWISLSAGTQGESLRTALGPTELSQGALAGFYGLGLAGMISFAVVALSLQHVMRSGALLIAVAAPMTMTIGTAEYLLHRTRQRASDALANSAFINGFAQRARQELRLMLAIQSAVVAFVVAIVLGVLHFVNLDRLLALFTLGYGLLSLALLLMAALLSMAYTRLAAWISAATGLLLVALPAAHHGPTEQVVLGQVCVIALLLVVTYVLVTTRASRASAHR